MDKMGNIHVMEYCLAMKRNEVLICATTWMDFENIMLSKRPSQKSDYVISLI